MVTLRNFRMQMSRDFPGTSSGTPERTIFAVLFWFPRCFASAIIPGVIHFLGPHVHNFPAHVGPIFLVESQLLPSNAWMEIQLLRRSANVHTVCLKIPFLQCQCSHCYSTNAFVRVYGSESFQECLFTGSSKVFLLVDFPDLERCPIVL